jgi:HKD family nuclease
VKRHTIFHPQPGRRTFRRLLVQELRDDRWRVVEIAVAWARRAGARALFPALRAFARRGGLIRITVGIDIEHTSREGLAQLLKLQKYGDVGLWIHHNELPYVTFHPKVYLFRNGEAAKLIIGSQNLTAGGLALNTEAALEFEGRSTAKAIVRAADTLALWRDPGSPVARPLTKDFLNQLVKMGYVLPEKRLRTRVKMLRQAIKRRRTQRLFGRQKTMRFGGAKRRRAARVKSAAIARALLMRVRKAHVTDRPTQTQLPKAVYDDGFFAGVDAIRSLHDGRAHEVRKAWARGIINTLKLEIPEMRNFADPVLRFLRGHDGTVVYEAYDRGTPAGDGIFKALADGRTTTPRKTFLTLPGSPGQATWWRFLEPDEV